MKRLFRFRFLLLWGCDFLVVALTLLMLIMYSVPLYPPKISTSESLKIYDRYGTLLRDVFEAPWGRTSVVALSSVSPEYIRALVAIEDRRFYRHYGIDPVAIARAIYSNTRHSKVRFGASTITQQLVRITWSQGRPRNIGTKIREAYLALRLDASLPKDSILFYYLNNVSFGNNCRGIEVASRFYYGKSSLRLTMADAALLAIFPQNPTRNNPFSAGQMRVRGLYKRNCNRLLRAGVVDSSEYGRLLRNPPVFTAETQRPAANHFVNYILSRKPNCRSSRIITTLDFQLQEECEIIVSRWLDVCAVYNVTNAAALVLDNENGEILAYIGSRDFFDTKISGQVDGVRSMRQPGSSIKPFLYGLALGRKFTPATLLSDIPTRFTTPGGIFEPLNYDKKYHGPVRLRQALACSYNIPAVQVGEYLTPIVILDALRSVGLDRLNQSHLEYGPGVALGVGEVTLLDLARAYTVFPRRGTYVEPRSVIAEYDGSLLLGSPKTHIVTTPYSSVSLRLIEDILCDNDARTPAFGNQSALNLPFPCAAKTGTSKDFKDNWCIGWTARFTVAVWVGNFDGAPMHNVSGISGAGPIFRDILMTLEKNYGPLTLESSRLRGLIVRRICPLSGALSTQQCEGAIGEYFVSGTEPHTRCSFHGPDGLYLPSEYAEWAQREGISLAGTISTSKTSFLRTRGIMSPPDSSKYLFDPEIPESEQLLKCLVLPEQQESTATIVIDKDTVVLNPPFVYYWQLRSGNHRMVLLDKTNKKIRDVISFRVFGGK